MPQNWEAEWKLGGVFDLMPDAVLVVSKDGTISKVNDHLAAMFGYRPEELIGSPVEILVPETSRGIHVGQRTAYEKDPHARPIRDGLDLRARRKDGTEFSVSIMLGPITGRGDDRTMAVVRDLAATERTRRRSYTDQLTGLPNRAALFHDLGEQTAAARPQPRTGNQAVALLDLTGLHDVNNSLGHAAGDEVLRSVARRLSVGSEGITKAYRLTGVRFVLLVSSAKDPLGLIADIRRGVGKLAEPIEVSGKSVSIRADVGIVLEAEAGRGIEELLADADLALYHAKKNGRDGYALFASFMRADENARRALAKEIEEAFKLGQLELFFQPQVRLSDLRLVGAEALLRWNYPTMGIVPPSIFLDGLVASPIVAEVGDWVLRSACCEAAEWRQMASSEIFVAANLFQSQIANPALPAKIAAMLAEVGLPAHLLELEISENFTLDNDDEIWRSLTALRAAGVGLALDDLGTGRASLTQVAKLPVSCLKIDQSFVRQMVPGGRDAILVEALVALAHKLDMQVVAEGVETEAQAKILSASSCDRVQGYFFGQPMPSLEFRALIDHKRFPILAAAAG